MYQFFDRALLALIVAAALLCHGHSAHAQTGECNTGAACPASGDQYPTGLFSTESPSFTVVASDIYAGEWARYSVVAGQTYEWSLCPADGGLCTYDAVLGLRTDAAVGTAICWSDQLCGVLPKIRWTATFTGVVRVVVTEYPCNANSIPTRLVWRCASCAAATQPVTIYDAWWSGEVDLDGDGCFRQGILWWDPDIVSCTGSATVFERLYRKPAASSTWSFVFQTTPHVITACSSGDAIGVSFNLAGNCENYDWAIEIYRSGETVPDFTLFPHHDPHLNDHPEESPANDASGNQAPGGSNFRQFRADNNTEIPVGGTIPFGVGVYFTATVTDPNPGDTIRLEIELRQLPATFTGVANYVSPYVPSGSTATTVTATGLATGNYGWRCRVIDNNGLAGPWFMEFNPDFIVAAAPSPDISLFPTSVIVNCEGMRPEPVPEETIHPFALGDLAVAREGRERKLISPAEILGPLDRGAATVTVIVNLARDERAIVDWDDPAALIEHQVKVAGAQDAVIAAVRPNDLSIVHLYENLWGFSADVTPAGLAALQDRPDVVAIEPVRIIEALGAQGIPLINGMTHRNVYNGAGMAVAICDTGVDYTHPRLGGGGFPNSKVIGGYDFGSGDSNPIAVGDAHGTACAGIAAGALGTVGDYIGGVAHNAKIYALKMSPNNSGSATGDAMIASWDWCVSHRNDDPANPLKIISTSFGGGRHFSSCDTTSPMMTSAAAAAVSAGITSLVASGNDGYCDSMGWPACISHVISVGAVYDANIGTANGCVRNESCAMAGAPNSCGSGSKTYSEATAADKVIVYSNSASFLTLLAPSENAYTTDIVGAGGYSTGDYDPFFSGTSAACPYAAGAAAALQSAAKHITGSFLTPAAVRSTLVGTGVNRTDGKNNITKPRVNLGAAINSLGPPPPTDCFTIFNNGSATLNVTSITTPAWATLVPAPPYSISAGSSQQVCVQACSACAGSDLDGDLTINSNDPDSPSVNVSVDVDCPAAIPPVIADIPNAMAQAPNPYTGPTPMLTHGTLPVMWTLQSGPAGMTINPSTGVVSWPTSTATGSPHTITIRASNTAGIDDESWTLTVSPAAPPPCDGDANGDGQVTFADITSVLENFGFTYPMTGPGDANHDGAVNFADITKVLERWGLPCP